MFKQSFGKDIGERTRVRFGSEAERRRRLRRLGIVVRTGSRGTIIPQRGKLIECLGPKWNEVESRPSPYFKGG